MCTLTWRSLPDGGYEAFFNRDELKTRSRAAPPRRFDLHGTAVLAPVDNDAGGTWISVNEHGLGLCLLNHYQGQYFPSPSGQFISRGLLVRDLSHHQGIEQASAALRDLPHDEYQPFQLLLLAFQAAPVLFTWDGVSLVAEEPPDVPLLASGLDIAAAKRNRLAQYRQVLALHGETSESLLSLHRSHEPAPSPISVCMHRDWSHTVSLTRMQICPDRVSLAYADGAPCIAPLGEPVVLQRKAVAE